MKRLLLITLIISLPAFYFISCKKDKGDPPLLPPYESMVIDFSNFTSQKKSADVIPDGKGTESSTWEFAASVAGVWNTLISSNIAMFLLLHLNLQLTIRLYMYRKICGNGAMILIWDLNTYKAKLQGKISTNTVTWKMYITYEGTGGI